MRNKTISAVAVLFVLLIFAMPSHLKAQGDYAEQTFSIVGTLDSYFFVDSILRIFAFVLS